MIVIRKLDQYNFILAELLDEPKVVMIKGQEVVYKYKNINKFYGRLDSAIAGLCRHLNKPKLILGEVVKPNDCDSHKEYLEVSYDKIKELING